MNALQVLCEKGGGDGSLGKAFTGESLVPEGEFVAAGLQRERVNPGHLPFADGGDFRRLIEPFFYQAGE